MQNSQRNQRKRPTTEATQDFDQIGFTPEFFAAKGKVLDDEKSIPAKPKTRTKTTRGKSYAKIHSSPVKLDTQSVSSKNPFRFPSIKNEEIFESKLQEAPSNTKKFKAPEINEDSSFTYSTIKFSGDDDADSYIGKTKVKAPKRSPSLSPAQIYSLQQSFGGHQTQFDTGISDDDDKYATNGGFKPSTKFSLASPASKDYKSSGKLFKSPEDEYKDSEYFDFSIRPRPGHSVLVSGPGSKFEKFSSDLGVKSLAIKSHKNKFDPPMHGGFKPSFKLRDFPSLHREEIGSGIASPGQIKTYYDNEDLERDEKLKFKLAKESNPASRAQLQQFLKAKDDERLEKLVEEQFILQQQKHLQQEKEAELKHQRHILIQQKEKLKQVEKELNSKVTRQTTRQKRRPTSSSNQPPLPPRRVRNSSPINFSIAGNGKSPVPLRTVKGQDGTYRVSFNVQ